MNNIELELFPKKEMFRLTRNGVNPQYKNKSESERKKLFYNNMQLCSGIEFTPTGFPQLQPYNGKFDCEYISFPNRNKAIGTGQALHFFIDDYKFYSIWKNLNSISYEFAKFDCILTPDFSCYIDVPDEFNRWSIFCTRYIGAHWQYNCGYDVIPTYCFGNVDSLKFALDGLPMHSVIAVCGVGIDWNPTIKALWIYALKRLEEEKEPSSIVVYGKQREVKGLHTPLFFIEDQITKYYRNNFKTINYGNSTNL